jgi:quinol monooxygenase YgiN
MVHVMAHVEARPETVDAVRRVFDALLAPSRAEPGCVDYQVFEDGTRPGHFVTVECWADQAAFDAHMASPHVAAAFAAAGSLLASAPHIAPYRRW